MSNLYVGFPLPSTVTLIDCDECSQEHPETRRHCAVCGRPSLFINPTGTCTTCTEIRPGDLVRIADSCWYEVGAADEHTVTGIHGGVWGAPTWPRNAVTEHSPTPAPEPVDGQGALDLEGIP